VVKRYDGSNAVLPTARHHAPVMVELSLGELPLFRLDAGPLDREPVGIESQLGEQSDVLGITMVVVTGIAGGLQAWRARSMLPGPPVAVCVTSLDLMGRRRCAPDEASGPARYLTAPAVRPETILRWKNRTRMTRGAVRIIDAAACAP
jgi:hypothetical protein